MKQVSLCLSDGQVNKLKELSDKQGISRNELVRRCIDAQLKLLDQTTPSVQMADGKEVHKIKTSGGYVFVIAGEECLNA